MVRVDRHRESVSRAGWAELEPSKRHPRPGPLAGGAAFDVPDQQVVGGESNRPHVISRRNAGISPTGSTGPAGFLLSRIAPGVCTSSTQLPSWALRLDFRQRVCVMSLAPFLFDLSQEVERIGRAQRRTADLLHCGLVGRHIVRFEHERASPVVLQ